MNVGVNMCVYFHILLALGFVLGEKCNNCRVNLTQPLTEGDPPCPVRNISNCTNLEFCGSRLEVKKLNNGLLEVVEYNELCIDSLFCANTSNVPDCPKSSCYLHCCDSDYCNRYNKANYAPFIPEDVHNFDYSKTSSTTVPSVTTSPANTTNTTLQTSTHKPAGDSDSLSVGAIAGIAVAIVVLVILIIVISIVVWRKYHNRSENTVDEAQNVPLSSQPKNT